MGIENVRMGGKAYGNGMAAVVAVGLDQLKGYRGTTPKPDELEWEIRLYEYILAQPDPEKAANQYFNARHHDGGLLHKRKAAEKLGWVIPAHIVKESKANG